VVLFSNFMTHDSPQKTAVKPDQADRARNVILGVKQRKEQPIRVKDKLHLAFF